ncbi:MAG: PASTA domain-containing protein, partial [Candidatus Humimicrobiaceae bacterium]
ESALLAGLLRAPEVYSPFNSLENAISRRTVVLNLMKEQGFIDEEQYRQAVEDPIILNTNVNTSGQEENRFAPFFIDYVKQQLYDKKFTDFDVFKGGLRIYTTLDKDLQIKAENSFKKIFKEPIGPSYSLISVDSNNGYIYAIVGGKDYSISKFNIATQGKRQPGSVFKVPVLLESIIKNIPPETTFNPNGPISIDIAGSKPWIVDNYGGEKFVEPLNPMNIVDATIHSVNVVYAQLIMQIGAENVEKLLNSMDIFDIGSNPAIALGGLEKGITPLDVSKIFSTIASGGVYHEPVCILKITDSSGNVLFEYDPQNSKATKKVFEEPQAFLATQILQRVINEGTGKAAGIGRPAAGKTGTTSDLRDAWFAGYTPELTTVVWMGYQESNKAMEPINKRNVTGGAFPAQIWGEFMKEALKGRPIVQFKTPENTLTEIQICKDSGMLPTYWCPSESLESRLFVKGMAPTKYCNIHNKITVPELTGLSADEARQILQGLFFNINEAVEPNNEYAADIVFRTDPSGGTVVEAIDNINPQITIFISQGKQTVKMPDLTGQTKANAESILAGLGFSISNVIYDFSSQPSDVIFNQDPAPDTDIDSGAIITIYISKGINPSGSVPNVIGMNKTDAITALNIAGFTNINFIEDQNSAAKDTVFNQNPPAGTAYDKAKQVIISISKGIKVPSVIELSKDDAIKLITSLGLTVEILPGPEATGKVILQSPDANTYINFGSKVTVTLENTAATSTTSQGTTSTTTSDSSSSSSSTTSSTSTSTTAAP